MVFRPSQSTVSDSTRTISSLSNKVARHIGSDTKSGAESDTIASTRSRQSNTTSDIISCRGISIRFFFSVATAFYTAGGITSHRSAVSGSKFS
jgi:hypothetical protein